MSNYSYAPQRDGYVFSKNRKKRMSGFRILLVSFIVLAVCCVGVLYFIFFGSFWNVASIRVEGSRLLEDSSFISTTIAELHARSDSTRIMGHDNMLFWMFRKNPMIIGHIPEAKEISIVTDFPERTVHIRVIERTIRAVACVHDTSECYGIDSEGMVFSRVPWIEGTLIPRFESAPENAILVGKKYFKKNEWLQNVLASVAILEGKGFIPSFIRIKEEHTEEWEAVMPSGIVFYFSLSFVPSDLERIIDDIATRVALEGISYFDLRIENKVYYK
jgi:cell division septal protein FtsQ